MTRATPPNPYIDLLRTCQAARELPSPSRRTECLALGRTLRDTSDISLAQQIGSQIIEVSTTDAAERAASGVLVRRIDWQQERQPDNKFGLIWIAFMAQPPHWVLQDLAINTEPEAFIRILAQAHIPLDPPAGWQPKHH